MPGVVASGVAKIVENIGRLPPDVFAETVQTERGEALVDDDGTYLCQQIVNQLQGRAQGVDVAEINDRFHKAGVILDLEDAEDIIKLLSFNFRFAAKNNLTAEQLVSKLDQSSSGWPKCALQTVHNMWSEQGAVIRTHQEAQVTMSVGQLVDVKWKLGMAVSSDSCRSLNSPYVSLLLKVADTSGQISHKSFEMTVPQFQNFFRQFKEIAAVLETV